MKRNRIYLVSLLAVAAWAAGEARCQTYGRPPVNPFPRPAFSPYLNLVRPGNPAGNYFSFVRPQNDFLNSLGQLRQQVGVGQQTVTDLETALAPPTTGHATQFLSHRSYFQNNGAPGTGVRPSAPVTPFRQPGRVPAPGRR